MSKIFFLRAFWKLKAILLVLSVIQPVWALDLIQEWEVFHQQRLFWVKQQAGNNLRPFISDGCSGGMSSVWKTLAEKQPAFRKKFHQHPPWEYCCVLHDRYYHAAGGQYMQALQGYLLRKQADLELRQCVLEVGRKNQRLWARQLQISEAGVQVLYAHIASLMYDAVRLGGLPCSGLPWRWGYGWDSCW